MRCSSASRSSHNNGELWELQPDIVLNVGRTWGLERRLFKVKEIRLRANWLLPTPLTHVFAFRASRGFFLFANSKLDGKLSVIKRCTPYRCTFEIVKAPLWNDAYNHPIRISMAIIDCWFEMETEIWSNDFNELNEPLDQHGHLSQLGSN